MNAFASGLWAESLKALRSKVPLFTALGFSLIPIMGGFFMIILKNPEAARSMGLISTKARLTAGTADWPAYLGMMAQAVAAGGAAVFSILTAWIFGREFSDRTAKELLALPTPRWVIMAAKFVVAAVWSLALCVLIVLLGLVVANAVNIPGYSTELLSSALIDMAGAALLTIALLPYVALIASAGHGYLPAIGWMLLTVILSQVATIAGWGDWFPWAIPALFTGMAGPRAGQLGPHSYVVIGMASLLGLAATFLWWRDADQTR
jgi:ABC-2 type transport system permease protein